MKKITSNIKLFFGLAMLSIATACAPELNEVTPSAGTSANFTKYIAIGNSLTAGYTDNGLYLEGQKVAFPNLIAEQLQKVGAAKDFNSPFFSQENRNGSGYMSLNGLINGNPSIGRVMTNLAIRDSIAPGKYLYEKNLDPITNLGVPGLRLDMIQIPGYGSQLGNPFFERLLPDATSATTTYLDFATSQNHTFFTFWVGNMDVLGYATNGAVTSDATNVLTTRANFQNLYTKFVDDLTANGQKGVLATIPDVATVPYFNTVTRSALLAAATAAAGQEINEIYFNTKSGYKAATNNDKFILTFQAVAATQLGRPSPGNPFPYGLDPRNPIDDKYVLDESEQVIVATRIAEFNEIIKEVAQNKGLALADAHAFLNNVNKGLIINGLNVNARYITGNAFSLDGIHLTPMGNALTANLFIDAINATYKSSIPKVNVTQYRGVSIP